MTQTYAEMTQQQRREVRMYGCTVAQMDEAVQESLSFRFSGAAMYVISMLSDAQDMAATLGTSQFDGMVVEDQRQLLNRAKWVLSQYCQASDQAQI